MPPRSWPPLWAAAVALWALVASVALELLPPEPGPFTDRPRAWALLVGGCCALPLAVADFVRERRVWLGTLVAWGILYCLGLVDTIRSGDSDVAFLIDVSFVLPGLVLFPLFAVSLLVRAWMRRPRRWRVEIEHSKLVFVRRA